MKRLLSLFLLISIYNTGLLLAEQEAPVVTKALRDSLQTHAKLARQKSENVRTVDIKTARLHVTRLLALSDSLQLSNADYIALAGDVEDMAFNVERNKPATSGKKIDETACLTAAKKCYLYYQKAYDLYRLDEERYGKAGLKQQRRIQQTALQYYLLTNGFQVNAGQSYKKKDYATTLDEFRMSFDGACSPFLVDAYTSDTKRFAAFEPFMTDSAQCLALYNCATLSDALGQFDASLAYYDSLKIRHYEPQKVFRNTTAIYASRCDTVMLMTELMQAVEASPEDTWFQKNLLQIYINRQQWSEAEQLADRVLAIDSADAQTVSTRGQLHEMRGDVENAMTCYMRSYDLDSTQANVCSYIGRIYYSRALSLRNTLYNQRKFREIDDAIQPIYEEALLWYERAFAFDTDHRDASVAMVLREILYSRFTKTKCPNRTELIAQYNRISKAYGLTPFGQ